MTLLGYGGGGKGLFHAILAAEPQNNPVSGRHLPGFPRVCASSIRTSGVGSPAALRLDLEYSYPPIAIAV